MDQTKASLADLRHRLVLHNCDLGPALASMAFASRPYAEEVARTHAREDLGADVPVATWLDLCDPARIEALFRRASRIRGLDDDALVAQLAERGSLADDSGPREVLSILTLPERLAPSHGRLARAVLANDAGVAIVRSVLGPPREARSRRGRATVFDPAHCAEAIVMAWCRRIPSLSELAATLRGNAIIELEALREAGRGRDPRKSTHTIKTSLR
ncbi:MAG: hypothetical protein JNK05_27945 [Myxococcales bacterium]|nr:hypothetical protein [Myxococcales bacterium]